MTPPDLDESPDRTAEAPGLPGLRSWRTVYAFALGCFVAYVILLAVVTRVYQ